MRTFRYQERIQKRNAFRVEYSKKLTSGYGVNWEHFPEQYPVFRLYVGMRCYTVQARDADEAWEALQACFDRGVDPPHVYKKAGVREIECPYIQVNDDLFEKVHRSASLLRIEMIHGGWDVDKPPVGPLDPPVEVFLPTVLAVETSQHSVKTEEV